MKEKLVGIVSPFEEPNYGTVLQAYALQYQLAKLGVKSEYIRYEDYQSHFKGAIVRTLKRIIRSCVKKDVNSIDEFDFFSTKPFYSIRKGYNHFVCRRIKKSPLRYTDKELSKLKRYDGFVVGSDQTWSQARCESSNRYFLLEMPLDSKKYSYAPSIGSILNENDYLKKLSSNIQNFKMISCREKCNCALLSKATGKEVHHVVDPTLLLQPKDWDKIAPPCILPRKKYILCYILGEKAVISDFAQDLGRITSLPVYYIVTRPLYLSKEQKLFPTPEDFISLIRDAAYVVTDSFHGTIFSINYGVSFYSFSKREGDINSVDNARIIEILTQLGLEDRFVSDEDKLSNVQISAPNYVDVHRKLCEMKTKSIKFLTDLVSDLSVTDVFSHN